MDYESSQKRGNRDQSGDAQQRHPAKFDGVRVLVLTGRFKGEEGVCLGKGSADDLWVVSPDCTDEILYLAFEKDFALLVDLSSDPKRN